MKKLLISMTVMAYLVVVGCSTHVHTIGDGPQDGDVVSARQWYALYGLIALNSVDVAEMSDGASDYEIKTTTSFVDGLLGGITGMVTVNCRTVKVTK